MNTLIYTITRSLQVQELTWEIIEKDKEVYLDKFVSLGWFDILLNVLLIGCAVAFALCVISLIIGIKRANKKGPDATASGKPILVGIVCIFLVVSLLAFKAFHGISSNMMRSLADREMTVKCATITNKYTDTWTDYGYNADDTPTTHTDYILADDNNNQFIVNKDVYDKAEVGSTYYIAQFVNSKDSVNIYNVEEYYYNDQE